MGDRTMDFDFFTKELNKNPNPPLPRAITLSLTALARASVEAGFDDGAAMSKALVESDSLIRDWLAEVARVSYDAGMQDFAARVLGAKLEANACKGLVS